MRTQSTEAAIEGVVLALRTVGCSCSKQPTYVSGVLGLSGKLRLENRLFQYGEWRGEMCTDLGDSGRMQRT